MFSALAQAASPRELRSEYRFVFQGSSKDTFCNHLKTQGNLHLQGNVQVYNVRIPDFLRENPFWLVPLVGARVQVLDAPGVTFFLVGPPETSSEATRLNQLAPFGILETRKWAGFPLAPSKPTRKMHMGGG